MAATELKSEHLAEIKENQLSTAFTKKNSEVDRGFFQTCSDIFGTVAKAISQPSWWKRVIKAAWFGAGVGTIAGPGGVALGAATGGLTQLIFEGINGFIGMNQQIKDMAISATIGAGALLGSIALTQITGQTIPQMIQGIMNFGDIIYNFNFDTPDSEIYSQINSIINSLYGQAGDFLGATFAKLLLTGTLEPPRVVIDVRGLALAYGEYADDKRKELMQGVSNFAWQGINAAKRIGFLFAFLKGRQAVKSAIKAFPGIEQTSPDLWKFATEWGNEEDPKTKELEVKEWRISTWVENKIESIPDPRLKDFVENFVESFADELRDGIEDYVDYVYN